MHAVRRREQRRGAGRGRGEHPLGLLHVALLVEVGCGEPLMQLQRIPCCCKDLAALDNAQSRVHAQPEALEQGGEVPRVDPLPVDIGLAANRVEPGAVEEGGPQRMEGERLVEPGDRAGGACQGCGKRRIDGGRARRVQQPVEHFSRALPPLLRSRSVQAHSPHRV